MPFALHMRPSDSQKRDYGEAVLIAGSKGMMGAALLSARACMRSGVGLLVTHVPQCGYEIMQLGIPEAKCMTDQDEQFVTHVSLPRGTDVVAVGPGLTTQPPVQQMLHDLLVEWFHPMVIDADALNILALHPEWLSLVPAGSVLTPHAGELHRLAIAPEQLSAQYGLVVVEKGHHTRVHGPDASLFVNTQYGNPGMAVGGSGDVLTGIILGLMAQHYSPSQAAILGVSLHALAADLSIPSVGALESLLPSDIIDHIGSAIQSFSIKP